MSAKVRLYEVLGDEISLVIRRPGGLKNPPDR
jgi:hypothetical protein